MTDCNICSFDIGYKNFAFYIDIENFTYLDCIFICKNSKEYNLDIFLSTIDKYYHVFKKCDIFLLEDQRFNNLKILHHLECYIKINFPSSTIVIINPYKKNRYLKFKGNYNKRKLQSVDFCIKHISTLELDVLSTFHKKDDIADSFCQLFFYKNFYLKINKDHGKYSELENKIA